MSNTRFSLRKNPFYKGFFLLLPLPLSFAAIVCAVVVLFQSVIAPSEYFQAIMNGNTAATQPQTPERPVVEVNPEEFPVIPYETQWATLNVDGWERKDIKVFFGDNNALLRQGAGMWVNSRFCGQNGKVVLSAHVTSHFHELEDMKAGDLVRMNTVYGDYVYQVRETKVFHYRDNSLLKPEDGKDVLLMYTCYPRKNGHTFKTQRLAVICDKVEGKDWRTDED